MDTERAKTAWRCRRGTRELDLVLAGFFKRHYDRLPAAEKKLFQQLLGEQDPVLSAWLLRENNGESKDVGKFTALIGKITAQHAAP